MTIIIWVNNWAITFDLQLGFQLSYISRVRSHEEIKIVVVQALESMSKMNANCMKLT
jgi:hypothetical protein